MSSQPLSYAHAVFETPENLTADRAGLIVGGWHPENGGEVYQIPLGGSLHKQSYCVSGSGSTYVQAMCEENWKEGMEEEEAIDFVKSVVKQAIRFDGSSGGVIRVAVLTKRGVERHVFTPMNNYKAPMHEEPRVAVKLVGY